MGTDTVAHLPSSTMARDIATVIGILLGAKGRMERLGNGSRDYVVEGAETQSYGDDFLASCVRIVVVSKEPPLIDGSHRREFALHMEGDDPYGHESYNDDWTTGGWKQFIVPSTPINVALMRRLVQFFGGVLDINDYDDHFDLEVEQVFPGSPKDREGWDLFQQQLEALPPLTDEEVHNAAELSSYRLPNDGLPRRMVTVELTEEEAQHIRERRERSNP